MQNIKLSNLTEEQTRELLPENLILLGYRGSIAHGCFVPENDPNSIDDKDIMGVYVADIAHYTGFGRKDVKEKFIEREDASQLLEIKRGEWSLEKVVAESERLFKLAEEAYVRSSLPAEPDKIAAENLCMGIIEEYHQLCK